VFVNFWGWARDLTSALPRPIQRPLENGRHFVLQLARGGAQKSVARGWPVVEWREAARIGQSAASFLQDDVSRSYIPIAGVGRGYPRIKAAIDAGTPKEELIASLNTADLGWKIGGQFWAPPERVDALVAELSSK